MMKQYKTGFQMPHHNGDRFAVEDGDAFVFSIPVTFCEYMRFSGFMIALRIGWTQICQLTFRDNTMTIDSNNPPTRIDFGQHMTEPNIIVTLHRTPRDFGSLGEFMLHMNGEHEATAVQIPSCDGHVDSVMFKPLHDVSVPSIPMTILTLAVFSGRRVPEQVDLYIQELRNFPAFQKIAPSYKKMAMVNGGGKTMSNGKQMGNGIGDGHSSESNKVSAADHSKMKAASTTVWPRAVDLILGSALQTDTTAKHDEIMAAWIKSRGEDISSMDYDYFVYSAGFAWPEAITLLSTDGDFLKVREKYMEVIAFF